MQMFSAVGDGQRYKPLHKQRSATQNLYTTAPLQAIAPAENELLITAETTL